MLLKLPQTYLVSPLPKEGYLKSVNETSDESAITNCRFAFSSRESKKNRGSCQRRQLNMCIQKATAERKVCGRHTCAYAYVIYIYIYMYMYIYMRVCIRDIHVYGACMYTAVIYMCVVRVCTRRWGRDGGWILYAVTHLWKGMATRAYTQWPILADTKFWNQRSLP